MTPLRHLDLKNASTPILADNAFAGMGLVSVSLPSDVASYGENLFSGNTMLCAVIWNAPKAIIKSGFRPKQVRIRISSFISMTTWRMTWLYRRR